MQTAVRAFDSSLARSLLFRAERPQEPHAVHPGSRAHLGGGPCSCILRKCTIAPRGLAALRALALRGGHNYLHVVDVSFGGSQSPPFSICS
eukprot:scaffold225180_cov15-Tisochrysis_lutea.AAC.1